MRQHRRIEEEEIERDRLKKQAEDEAAQLLQRLQLIEDEESERLRKKRLAELEFQIQTDKIQKLMEDEVAMKFRTKIKLPTSITNQIETSEISPTYSTTRVKSRYVQMTSAIVDDIGGTSQKMYEHPLFAELA